MAKSEYVWGIEPLGDVSHANAVIARELGEEVDDIASKVSNFFLPK